MGRFSPIETSPERKQASKQAINRVLQVSRFRSLYCVKNKFSSVDIPDNDPSPTHPNRATEHTSSSSNGALQPANDGETNVPASKPLPANSERGVSEDVKFNLREAEERPDRKDKAQDQQSRPNRGRGHEGRGGRGGGKGSGQDQKRKE